MLPAKRCRRLVLSNRAHCGGIAGLLITTAYRDQLKDKHRSSKGGFGISGHRHSKTAHVLCLVNGLRSMLDYGCGQGYLKAALPEERHYEVFEYDPAIKGKD